MTARAPIAAPTRAASPTYRYWGSVKPPAHRAPLKAEVTATTDGTTATIRLFDPIDAWGGPWGVSAKEFASMLDELDADTIDLLINSPGGDVFDGIAIFNALLAHPATVNVTVEGLAASAASVVALAGESITMGRGAQMMIHDAWGLAIGNADDMTAQAGVLDKLSQSIAGLYADRAGGSADSWRSVMKAEAWYTADEAVDAGLADSVVAIPAKADSAQNQFDLSIFRHAGRDDAPAPTAPTSAADPAVERAVGAIAGNAGLLRGDLSADAVAKLADARDAIEAALSIQDKASGATNLPLSARNRAWDADGAEKRVRAWAGGGDSLDDMNWTKYRRAFFWYDDQNPELVGSYKLPFADVIDGDLTAVWRGVTAAAAVVNGSRGGVDIPDSDVPAAKRRIKAYYDKAADQYDDDTITVPWGDGAKSSAAKADAGPVGPEQAKTTDSLPESEQAAATAAAVDGSSAAQEVARLTFATLNLKGVQ